MAIPRDEARFVEEGVGAVDAPDDTEAFFDVANEVARFHLNRSESAQQRAVGVLGFSGVLISLIPLLIPLLRRVDVPIAAAAVVFMVIGAMSLVAAVGWAAATIAIQKVQYPTTQGVRDRYEARGATNREVREEWAAAMLRESIPDFTREANTRTSNLKAAVLFSSSGVLLMAMSLLILTIGYL